MRYQEIASLTPGESSEAIRGRVAKARLIQQDRFKGLRRVHSNAGMSSKALQKYCALDHDAQHMLKAAITDLNFSARAYDRILKVARTIANLAGHDSVRAENVAEAIQYRALDRQAWL